MSRKKQKYCSYCGEEITFKKEGDTLRVYCSDCNSFFYDNPLPVVSSIHCIDRKILLVKRKNEPYKGKWCLPTGFAEINESIEDAALRELKEEAGIDAKIINLVDVDSVSSRFYGDLTFITFEVEHTGGKAKAGDDAIKVKYFSIDKLPVLAFKSNTKAIKTFIRNKVDYWAIVDSFNIVKHRESLEAKKKYFLSDQLIEVIDKNADLIANKWVKDIEKKPSTLNYGKLSKNEAFKRGKNVIDQFGFWLRGKYTEKDNREFYLELGRQRKKEGFKSSEVISGLSLIRKNIWEFALSQGMWNKTIDIYIALELERRMMLFFDKAAFFLSKGYEEENLKESDN